MRSEKQEFAFPEDPLPPEWVYTVGAGSLECIGPILRFCLADATATRYSDAQIDDYRGRLRRRFPWRPPLRMTVRARFSHPSGILRGTAGFGFWNDPFLMTGGRLPALPRAVWFFYGSPPSDMKLDLEVSGWGWKAATIDATSPQALLWAPLAPVLVPLMNLRALYRRLWAPGPRAPRGPGARDAAGSAERPGHGPGGPGGGGRRGAGRGCVVGGRRGAPRAAGGVMWMDNQYMVATPWGRLGWGLLDVPGAQWMEVEEVMIRSHSVVL